MAVVDKLLSGLFGNKAEKDYKRAQPVVEKVHEYTVELENLSHDELRARSAELKISVRENIKEEVAAINDIKARIEADEIPLAEREEAFNEVDRLEQEIIKKNEKMLGEILEEVTHDELMTRHGHYYTLYASQQNR